MGTTVDSMEFENFDANIAKAVDGTGGGAYALESDLILGGAPGIFFEVEIPTIFGDSVTMQESLTVAEDIVCSGQVQTQRLDVNFDARFDGLVNHYGEVFFEDDLTANNDIFLNGGVYVYGQIGFYNNAYFENDSEFNAPVTINGPVALTAPLEVGSGGYVTRRTLIVSTSTPPGGVSPAEYDEVLLDSSSYPSSGVALIKDDVNADVAMTFVAKNGVPVFLGVGIATLGILCANTGVSSGTPWMKRIEARRKSGTWFVFDATEA